MAYRLRLTKYNGNRDWERGTGMSTEPVVIEEPRIARLLFSDSRFGWLWLPLRLYLGYMVVRGRLA